MWRILWNWEANSRNDLEYVGRGNRMGCVSFQKIKAFALSCNILQNRMVSERTLTAHVLTHAERCFDNVKNSSLAITSGMPLLNQQTITPVEHRSDATENIPRNSIVVLEIGLWVVNSRLCSFSKSQHRKWKSKKWKAPCERNALPRTVTSKDSAWTKMVNHCKSVLDWLGRKVLAK